MQIVVTRQPQRAASLFANATEAAKAIIAVEAVGMELFQYELTTVHSGGNRLYDGFQVRVRTGNGLALGYLTKQED